jgi:hypothetical protein
MAFSRWVGDLIERGLIESVARDTSGHSFQITAKGRVFLGER